MEKKANGGDIKNKDSLTKAASPNTSLKQDFVVLLTSPRVSAIFFTLA